MTNQADILVEHIKNCTEAQAAVVVDGNADEIVARMLAAGWTIDSRVDHIAGKRIQFLTPPIIMSDIEEFEDDSS